MALQPATRARVHATLAAIIGCLVVAWTTHPFAVAIAILLSVLALLAWLAPTRYAPVQRFLDGIARGILVGFSWLALGLVYFGLFTPLRIWRALTLRDPLALGRRDSAATYFQPMRPTAARHFERQF